MEKLKLRHTAWMTSSWEGKSRWPGVVLGKIKSLWSSSQGSTSDGLNQLIDSSSSKIDTGVVRNSVKVHEGLNQLIVSSNKATGRSCSLTHVWHFFSCVLFCVLLCFLSYPTRLCDCFQTTEAWASKQNYKFLPIPINQIVFQWPTSQEYEQLYAFKKHSWYVRCGKLRNSSSSL